MASKTPTASDSPPPPPLQPDCNPKETATVVSARSKCLDILKMVSSIQPTLENLYAEEEKKRGDTEKKKEEYDKILNATMEECKDMMKAAAILSEKEVPDVSLNFHYMCLSCDQKPAEVLVSPCRHLTTCKDCDAFHSECLVCGEDKVGTTYVRVRE